jgi:hypothetical protein
VVVALARRSSHRPPNYPRSGIAGTVELTPSLAPPLPRGRMTMEMRDGKYGGGLALDDEEDTEWKAVEDCATDVTRHNRELQRPLLYSAEYVSDGLEKFRAKPRPFAVVPQGRLEDIELRLRTDVERPHRDKARSRRSSRSRTSPQGRASLASAARWAARRSSRSWRCHSCSGT